MMLTGVVSRTLVDGTDEAPPGSDARQPGLLVVNSGCVWNRRRRSALLVLNAIHDEAARMETDRTPIEARQARKPGIVRYMLLISLAAIVAIMAIAYFYFSSTSGQ